MTNRQYNDRPAHVVVFSGPRSVGKDTCASILANMLRHDVVSYKMTVPMDAAIMGLFDMSKDEYNAIRHTPHKLLPREEFGGLCLVDILISLSEDYVKPRLGDDFFGKRAVRHLSQHPAIAECVVIISDSRFTAELAPIAAWVGCENMTVLKLKRPGYFFMRDHIVYGDKGLYPDTDVLQCNTGWLSLDTMPNNADGCDAWLAVARQLYTMLLRYIPDMIYPTRPFYVNKEGQICEHSR